jgi:hypothetical protein
VKRKYYNAESLGRALSALEREHGMSSAEFYAKAAAGEKVAGVPGFTRALWTSLYRDFCRLGGDDFALSVQRTLQRV